MTAKQKWGAFWGGLLILALVWIFSPNQSHLHAQDLATDKTLLSNASSLHPVEVFSVSQKADSILEVFALAGKDYYPEDKVSYFPDPSLGLGTVVTVQRALPVTVIDGKKTRIFRTWQTTIGELFKEKMILLGEEDRITPALGTKLAPNTTVTIIRVERTTINETEIIPFQTVIEKDYYSFVGTQTVLTAGKNGQRQNTFLLIREDGELKSKTLISTKVTEAAQTARVKQGALNPVSSRCLQYKDWVVDASLKNRVDPNALYYRMIRESNCNPNSLGQDSSFYYQGLFQYQTSAPDVVSPLWVTLSGRAGFGGASVWDARAQIYTTAWAWNNGYRSRWPNP